MKSLFLFLLKTRVSTRLAVFILVYGVLISLLEALSYGRDYPYLRIVAEAFVSSFAFASIAFGGLIITKSDADFLVSMPLNRAKVALYLFVIQAIGGVLILSMVLGAFAFLEGGAAIFSLPLYVLNFNSWSVISTRFSSVKRWTLAGLASLWFLTSIAGNPYSPGSAIAGELTGLAILAPLSLTSLALAIHQLYNTEELVTLVPSLSFSGKYFVKLRFVGKGRLAVLSYYSQIASWTVRVPYLSLLSLSSLFASLLYAFALRVPQLVGYYMAFVISVAIMAGISIAGVNLILGERLWVAFTSMKRAKYLRAAFLSSLAFYFQLSLPFILVDLLLASPITIRAGFDLLLLGPLVYVIRNYAEAYLSPQQIRDPYYRPERTLGSYLVPLTLSAGLFTISVMSVLVPGLVFLSTVALAVICTALLSDKGLEALAERLAEQGFV